jgi:hypothetical protein
MKKTRIKGNSLSVFFYLLFSVLIISCDKEVSLNETTATATAAAPAANTSAPVLNQ